MTIRVLTLFFLSGLFFTLFHPGHPMTVDSATTLQTVRALARGHLDIPRTMVTREGREGLQFSYYGPLLPVLSLPAYWVGSLFDSPPPPPGSPEMGWGDWLALNTNQWISAAILPFLFFVGVRAGLPWKLSWGLAFACGVSTQIFPYARDYFSQPLCALLLVVAGTGIVESSKTPRRFPLVAAAIATALLPWARMDMGTVFPGLFLWVILETKKNDLERANRRRTIFLLPFLVSLVFLFLFDSYRWGTWSGAPYGDHSFTVPLMDSLPRFLFSPDLSLFLHNPFLLLAMGFLLVRYREMKPLAFGLLVMDLSYLVLIGKFRDYHGGLCPGPRYLLSLVPLNLFPLFLGWARAGRLRKGFYLLLAGCFIIGLAINGYEALVDYTRAPSAWDYWTGVLLDGDFSIVQEPR